MTIRTRFAPSPTGYIHVGNVRAALFPWLLTRQQGGSFILRIEDTDRSRFVPGAEDLILDTLEWLGIDWDEGPRKGGSHGPYHQSERLEIYHSWAKKLVEKGLAYADPYTPEEVQGFREEAHALKKAFLYRDYRPENPPEWAGTQPLRFKVTAPKRYTWNDPVMGELSAGPEALDLSLYEALEITPPTLVCLPHIMAPDGRKKLGKRDGAKSVTDYRTDGILPEAMLNFLASMGWNDGTEQEIFSRQELIDKFSLDRVQRSGARFDEKRLLWMNGQWIRQISLDDLYQRVESYWPQSAAQFDASYKHQVLALVQDRLKTLAELPMMSRFFFEEPEVNWELITSNKQLKKLSDGEIHALLQTAHDKLAELADWNPEAIQEALNQLLEITGQKPGVLFSLIRIVTTWAPFSPQLNDTLALFGKDKTLSRIASQL